MIRKVLKHPRLWLICYLIFQAILFYVYSFPVIKPFQQLWSGVFLGLTLLGAIFLRERWLLLPLLASFILINPLYTLSVEGLTFRNKILIGLAVALVVFVKRRERLMLVGVLFLGNVGLLCGQYYKVYSIDRDFREQLVLTRKVNRLYLQADSAIKAGKNIYVILLDGYPDPQILKDSFQYDSKLYSTLNQFRWEATFTSYYSSPVSFLNLFAGYECKLRGGSYPEYQLSNLEFFRNALDSTPLTKRIRNEGYDVRFHSLMLEKKGLRQNAFNPVYVPRYSINEITYLIWRYFILKERGTAQPIACQIYHSELFDSLGHSLKQQGRKFQVFHFLTFHNGVGTIQEDAAYADSIGLAVIQRVEQEDSSATIIVLSDHGERIHLKNKDNFNRGIYAIKP